MRFKSGMKKVLFTFFIATACVQPSFADENTPILQSIYSTTYGILTNVNNLPTYIQQIVEMAQSWKETNDRNNIIGNNQAQFNQLLGLYNQSYTTDPKSPQITLSKEFTRNFLVLKDTSGNESLPEQANDLSYSILAGSPLVDITGSDKQSKLEKSKKNFIQNISGAGTFFKQPPRPLSLWKASDAKNQYVSMYNTSAAIASFNSFVLADLLQGNNKDTVRVQLMQKASNSGWFTNVASEPLGLVLRQILMYTSQVYVQLDRSIKIQQQQLLAQTMTNSLLVQQLNYTAGTSLYMLASETQ